MFPTVQHACLLTVLFMDELARLEDANVSPYFFSGSFFHVGPTTAAEACIPFVSWSEVFTTCARRVRGTFPDRFPTRLA